MLSLLVMRNLTNVYSGAYYITSTNLGFHKPPTTNKKLKLLIFQIDLLSCDLLYLVNCIDVCRQFSREGSANLS